MSKEPIDKQLVKVTEMEKDIDNAKGELYARYPDVFEQIKIIEEQSKELDKLKEAIKQRLIDEDDFDAHEIGDFVVSVSAVAKIKVVDIDKVPDDFKEVKTVVNEKKAREYLKLMHRPPEGCVDNSFYRLNWRDTSKNKKKESL